MFEKINKNVYSHIYFAVLYIEFKTAFLYIMYNVRRLPNKLPSTPRYNDLCCNIVDINLIVAGA